MSSRLGGIASKQIYQIRQKTTFLFDKFGVSDIIISTRNMTFVSQVFERIQTQSYSTRLRFRLVLDTGHKSLDEGI